MSRIDVDRWRSRFGSRVRFEEPLAGHTSFLIGGPVEVLVFAKAVVDIVDAIGYAQDFDLPWLVLGRGSNVLVDDKGIRGVVIRNDTSAIAIGEESGLVQGDSGVRLPSLGAQTAKIGLQGLEFAIGIPGSVGGGVVMNAGAHGGSIAEVLVEVDVLVDGRRESWKATRLAHAYRSSVLQSRRDVVVLGATFRLARGAPDDALARLREFRAHRRETQPGDPGAGSIFRNPPGGSAGALIDRAGLKGVRKGGAMISPKHANFIVNVGGARSADVLALVDLARDAVFHAHGILLHPEIELIEPSGRASLGSNVPPPPSS